ncbi:MAG: type II secretion system F family protein [Methylococcales bacterium]|nr:type II secretion system F family protein [Methylococcales bacterium]
MATDTNPIDYVYKAKDKKGIITKGVISALNEMAARKELRTRGVKIITLKKKPKDLFGPRKQAIVTKDICIFARQLATMLEAGVPLVQSFDIIGKGHENPSMAELIIGIKVDVESGDTLGQALKKRPLYFDDLFCNLVEAGEQAGVLEGLLDKIATYKEKSESMRAKVKKALTYPIAVIVVAFVVTVILLIFVVPVFDDVFQSFGAELPAFTQLVVEMSDWMQDNWWIVVGVLIAFVKTYGFIFKRSEAFRHFVDRTMLKIPIVGVIIEKSAIARFARTLSTMSAAGVPLIEALDSVAGACGNIVFYDGVKSMQDEVSTGQSLQASMLNANIFPHMVIQMVAIGEESGSIDSMLDKVADFFEEEVDNLVDNLSSLMEPMIMVILGTLVGGLVVAMYLPIFQMGAAVG